MPRISTSSKRARAVGVVASWRGRTSCISWPRARSPSTMRASVMRHAVDLGRVGLGHQRDAQRARAAGRSSHDDGDRAMARMLRA